MLNFQLLGLEIHWLQLFIAGVMLFILIDSFGIGFLQGLIGRKQKISMLSFEIKFFKLLLIFAAFFALYSVFSDKTFENKEACFEYAKRAGNMNKAMAGVTACTGIFHPEKTEQTNLNRRFSQCFLNDFNSVKDDNSGTTLSTKCAESTKNYNMGRLFARNYFSQVAKIEEILDDQRRFNNQPVFPAIQQSPELPDGPILFNKNGESITCMKIGVTINCD